MQMIVMAPNKSWSDPTNKEKALSCCRGWSSSHCSHGRS